MLLNSLATKILIEGKRAIGIEFIKDGAQMRAAARKGVVLSAGTFGTPQLLMLSGIGPAEHLKEKGIEVLVDLPGVGLNLQDHAGTSHLALVNVPTYNVIPRYMMPFIGLQWFLTGRGAASSPVAQVIGAHHFDDGTRKSRLQVMFTPGGFELGPGGLEFLTRPAVTGLTNVHRPYSAGWMKLRSNDPREQLSIQPNLFADERDVETLVAGHHLMRKIFSTKPLADYVVAEL